MLESYRDIIDKLGQPRWWDEQGVPRYCRFRPTRCGVYIDAAALLLIACQDCNKRMKVASVRQMVPHICQHGYDTESHLSLSYGDPPYHDCPGAGEVMTSETIAVLRYWEYRDFQWQRVKSMECLIDDGMARIWEDKTVKVLPSGAEAAPSGETGPQGEESPGHTP